MPVNLKRSMFLFSALGVAVMLLLARPAPVAAQADPTIASVLIGNWQYYIAGGGIVGSVRFDGLTGGTIYDNRYGTAVFTGKFNARNVFEGTAQYPGYVPGKINLTFDFYHPQGSPGVWSFKGWVKDYANGAFINGKKL